MNSLFLADNAWAAWRVNGITIHSTVERIDHPETHRTDNIWSAASGAECKAVCTEAGMFALRERRIHVTQEDFEMAVAKVMKKDSEANMSLKKLWK